MKIGIVGLPNVGKSTLFNALTKSESARAANFPFCTIDPNVGIVEVPDSRMEKLAEIVHPDRMVPAIVEFVDIAGLVKGASQGEGLGNQFLAHIRECDAIAQVVRMFIDKDVHHVHGDVDPKRDTEIVQTELILADLQTVKKRMDKARSDTKSGDAVAKKYLALVEKVHGMLEQGTLVIDGEFDEEERVLLKDLMLLTAKPYIYVVNIDANDIGSADSEQIRVALGLRADAKVVPISAKIEAEVMVLPPEDSAIFLAEYGLKEPGLNLLAKTAYDVLGLQTYFTAGVMEVRAWTIMKGDTAPVAAGKIHTDFEKGFIRAEVISYEDYIACGGEKGARETGKLRVEGKEYIVRDGDVMHFLTSK